MKKRTILFVGGGSGGHIIPIRAVFLILSKDHYFSSFYWAGMTRFERDEAQRLRIPFIKINTGKLRRYSSIKNILDIFKTITAFIQSLFWIAKIKPSVVFATGGFVSVPIVFAAKIFRIRVVIHEQTSALGLANKLSALVADDILLSDSDSKQYLPKRMLRKVKIVGNPINPFLLEKRNLSEFFPEITQEKNMLYITGGGQGSNIINGATWEILPQLVDDWFILHQCGFTDYDHALSYRGKFNASYFPVAFVTEELGAIYRSADLVISRSGAGTINDLSFFDIPAILIPLEPCNNNEQMRNAEKFTSNHHGYILKQNDFNSEKLLIAIKSLKSFLKRKRIDTPPNTSARLIANVLYQNKI